jgi:cyanophycinase
MYDQRSTVGPDRGWLIIQGGGRLTNEVRDRFIALAGGSNASIVAIPTAMADKDIDSNRYATAIARVLGVSQVTVLHTRDRTLANSPTFVEPLRHATGVWLEGGRQWRLADAYLGTATLREIKDVLQRGGVIIGGSAGATIQGSFLVRGDSGTFLNPDGDNRIMVSPGHVTGFGLLAGTAIDQHVDARAREPDLDPVVAARPRLLGIGLYQDAAIIVHANSFFVVSAPVLIHDGRKHGNRLYYTLSPGEVYDLKSRAVVPVISDAEAREYPSELTLTSTARTSRPRGTVTQGSGVLQIRGAAPSSARSVSVLCDAALYSVGAVPHPARLDGATDITILSRELGGDELRSSKCRITDADTMLAIQEELAAPTANPSGHAPSDGLNMNCGQAYSPNWDNCVGVVTYPNGNIYRGEFHHGMREGFGFILINAKGVSDQNSILSNEPAIYAGEFRGDRLNGRGIWITQLGTAYFGTYRDNIAQPGVARTTCTGTLTPSWSNCVATLQYENGNVYRGEFVNGQREGIGMIEIRATGTLPDATGIRTPVPGVYVGEFKGDRLNGRGMIFMPGAGFYGKFTNNVFTAN